MEMAEAAEMDVFERYAEVVLYPNRVLTTIRVSAVCLITMWVYILLERDVRAHEFSLPDRDMDEFSLPDYSLAHKNQK